MKILYITPEAPGNNSGGQLCVKQSLFMLNKVYSTIDYIGPKYLDKEIDLNINKNYFLKEENNFIYNIINTIRGGTSKLYTSMIRILKYINFDEYDYIYLEFSKWDFIAKLAYKKNIKLIVRVHNVEQDYFVNIFKNTRNIKNLIKCKLIQAKERRVFKYSSIVLPLTNNDCIRINELYKKELIGKSINIVPICVGNFNSDNVKYRELINDSRENKKTMILTTGSLWYGPNSEGIIWFINNVYKYLKDTTFIIAGSNPNEELLDVVKKYDDVILIANPDNMDIYFRQADLYIAPIFYGAGMKVKIAEALSYGIPIIGSKHSFIGYEINDKVNGIIANNKDEFINSINYFERLDYLHRRDISEEAYRLYKDKYSLENSYKYIKNIFK